MLALRICLKMTCFCMVGISFMFFSLLTAFFLLHLGHFFFSPILLTTIYTRRITMLLAITIRAIVI